MTAGGTDRWRRMGRSAPCGAVSNALRAPKEKTYLGLPRWSCRCAMNREGPLLPLADHTVSREPLRDPLGEGPVSSFMSNWPRAMGR